jgi:hypothetical protein
MRQLPEDWCPAPFEDFGAEPGIEDFLHDLAFFCVLIGAAAILLFVWNLT